MNLLVFYKPGPARVKLTAYGAQERSLGGVNPPQMRVQRKLPDETFPTLCTGKRLLSGVDLLVFKKLPLPFVVLPALRTGKGSLTSVRISVLKKGRVGGEAFPALGARERRLVTVGFTVFVKTRHGPVALAALRADERELTRVDALVAVKVGLPRETLPTSRAGIWLLPLVGFQMLHEVRFLG